MRILHLTDFHFNSKGDIHRQKKIISSFLANLSSEEIDFIFFTGDLVFNGSQKDDFDEAKELLIDGLSEKLDVGLSQIFLCAGNHDVDRSRERSLVTKHIDEDIRDNKSLDKFFLKSNVDYKDSLKPCLHYNNFIERNFKKDYDSHGDYLSMLYSTHSRIVNGKTLGIQTINTAWRAVGKNDDGNLVFPIAALEEGYSKIRNCDLKILLLHHNTDKFNEYNSYNLEEILYKKYDLAFFGHIHKNKITVNFQHGENGLVAICSPAIVKHGQGGEIGYSIIEIDEFFEEYKIEKVLYDENNEIFYPIPTTSNNFPSSQEKQKQNKFRKVFLSKFKYEHENASDLFLSKDKKSGDSTFLDLFTPPVLKDVAPTEVVTQDINSDSTFDISNFYLLEDDFVVIGKDKCGKTSLARRIQIEFLKKYNNLQVFPFYINLKELSKKASYDFLREFKNYFQLNTNDAKAILASQKVILICDNYYSTNSIINQLETYLENNKELRIILFTNDNISNQYVLESIFDRALKKLYFHKLRKKQICLLTERWNETTKNNLEPEHTYKTIDGIFQKLSIPFNFWTVSLFLWIINKNQESGLQSDTDLINLYIETLLERENLIKNRSPFSFDKYKKYLSFLAHHLLSNYQETTYSIPYSELITFTKEYIEKNPRNSISEKEVIDYLVEREIIKKKSDDENYTFRLNGVFEYFIANYFCIDPKFRKDIIDDENIFLSFKNEIELYAGFNRNDKDFLVHFYDKTKKYFSNTEKNYSQKNNDLDQSYQNKIIEVNDFENNLKKASTTIKALSIDEQDKIEEIIADELHLANEVSADVKLKIPKGFNAESIEDLGDCLSLFGKVYKNIDDIDDVNLVYEIFDYIIEGFSLWGLKLIDEYKKMDIDGLLIDKKGKNKSEDNAVFILKALTHFIPAIIQEKLNESIGHNNLEQIISKRLSEYNSKPKGNQFKILLLTLLMTDIDLERNYKLIDLATKNISIPILKNSLLLKLNYYYGFKNFKNVKIQTFIHGKIMSLCHSINPKTDSATLQQGLHKNKKKKGILRRSDN